MKKIKNTEKEKNINDPIYWENKMDLIIKIELDKSKKNNDLLYILKNKKLKTKSFMDYKIFQFASTEILNNQDLMLVAIEKGFIGFYNLPENLKNSRDFTKRYLNESSRPYSFVINKEFLEEEFFIKEFIRKDASAYKEILYDSKLFRKFGDVKYALDFLDLNPKTLEFFPTEIKKNILVAEKAIKIDIQNLKLIPKVTSSKLTKNKDFVLKILKEDPFLFEKVNAKFKKDKDVALLVLSRRSNLLIEFDNQLLKDRDVILTAASAYNLIDLISEEYKNDYEIIKKHLYANPNMYKYLHAKIDKVDQMMEENIKEHYYVYERLDDSLKEKENLIYALIANHYEGYGRSYEEITNKKNNEISYNYIAKWNKKSVWEFLPTHIKRNLEKEFFEENKDNKSNLWGTPEEEEKNLLMFAVKKYTKIYLNENLNKETNKTKKLKI